MGSRSVSCVSGSARARIAAAVPIEVEGEPIGSLPATFEVISSRLRVIC